MRQTTMAGLAVLGAMATPAAAAPIQFIVAANCVTDCATSGLAAGDKVQGNLTVDSTNFTPGGSFTNSDISSFIFNFGSSWIETPRPGADYPAGGWYGVGSWGDAPDKIDSLLFTAGPGPFAPVGVGINITYNWQDEPNLIVTSLRSQCDEAACYTITMLGSSFTDAPTVVWEGEPGPAPIPVPPALALLLTGVAGLGAFGLRRRRG